MATDAEESDTDEQPTKRLRLGSNDHIRMNQRQIEMDENTGKIATRDDDENNEIDRRARERLKKWQARQVAKGFVDNTINRVLENYVVAPAFGELHSRHSSRANDMEDRAVAMAIRNHGLVQPDNFVPNPDPPICPDDSVNNYWIGEGEMQVRCTCPLNIEQNEMNNIAGPAAPSDERSKQEEGHSWVDEKGDDNNQQHDFLERAVAEAIKKKGLSALSVDYG